MVSNVEFTAIDEFHVSHSQSLRRREGCRIVGKVLLRIRTGLPPFSLYLTLGVVNYVHLLDGESITPQRNKRL